MNLNSIRMIIFALIACAPTSMHAMADYQNIQARNHAAIATYHELLQKWQPALINPSKHSLLIIIDRLKNSLHQKCQFPFNTHEEEVACASIRDLEAWPFRFICEELDRDIKTLVMLNDEMQKFDMISIQIKPFYSLRAHIERLSCYAKEQDAMVAFSDAYKKYMLGFMALGYLMVKEPLLSDAVFQAFCICGAFHGLVNPQQNS